MDQDELKNAFDAAVGSINSLAKIYEALRFTGFLVVVGAAIIIFTAVVAFQTPSGEANAGFLNITSSEQVLFMITGITLILVGGGFLALRALFQYRKGSLRVELDIARLNGTAEIVAAQADIGRRAIDSINTTGAAGDKEDIIDG